MTDIADGEHDCGIIVHIDSEGPHMWSPGFNRRTQLIECRGTLKIGSWVYLEADGSYSVGSAPYRTEMVEAPQNIHLVSVENWFIVPPVEFLDEKWKKIAKYVVLSPDFGFAFVGKKIVSELCEKALYRCQLTSAGLPAFAASDQVAKVQSVFRKLDSIWAVDTRGTLPVEEVDTVVIREAENRFLEIYGVSFGLMPRPPSPCPSEAITEPLPSVETSTEPSFETENAEEQDEPEVFDVGESSDESDDSISEESVVEPGPINMSHENYLGLLRTLEEVMLCDRVKECMDPADLEFAQEHIRKTLHRQ